MKDIFKKKKDNGHSAVANEEEGEKKPNTPEMQKKIDKVASLENSENWKKLKDATNVRYIQKIAEDPKAIKMLKKRTDGADLEGGVIDALTGMTKKEETELIEDFAIKKQEAFDEASKRGKSNNADLKIIPSEEMNRERVKEGYRPADGLHNNVKNEVKIAEELGISRKLAVMDHEIGHKYQANLYKDKKLSENADLKQDYDAFKYDRENYDSKNLDYYKASLLERDTRKNERVTKKGLDQIGDKILDTDLLTRIEKSKDQLEDTKKEITKDQEAKAEKDITKEDLKKAIREEIGYVGINRPKELSKGDKNPFENKKFDAKIAKDEMENMVDKVSEKENLQKKLSSKEKKELNEILKTFEDFKRLEGEIGENDKRLILENLDKQIKELKERSPKIKSLLEIPKPVDLDDIKLEGDLTSNEK
ncbi:MAG: hypothetical protein Q7K48_07450 [Fusobacterium sp. JB021]|nr:hypothetical protein [Fusobacterium sp. JB021]